MKNFRLKSKSKLPATDGLCIENLNLSGCKDLVEIDPSIGRLDRLVNLNLMGCMKLKCLPSSVCNLTALEQLDLDGCSILERLHDRLGNMKSLSMLRAGCTAITTVPKSIEYLSKLVILKLNECKRLCYLPYTLCNLRKLEHLILYGYSNVKELPHELGKLESLRILSAEYTAITSLPESIGYMSKLNKLLLHSCKELRYLPSSICNLGAVECLDLNYCSNLQELPDQIGNMESLKLLQAVDTAITTLPESTGRLSKLVEILLCSCKRLTCLPSSICNLESLECLDLSGCSALKELPDDIGKIKNLRELRACNSIFTEVPRSIGCLKNLEILVFRFQAEGVDLNLCSILKNTRFIPASVWWLFTLKNLNLSDCYLVDLPDSIQYLSSLQHLNLSRNHFSILTSSLGQLYNLKTLTLTGCKRLWAILELPPNLTDLYASYCTSIETLVVEMLSLLRCLYLSYCSSLVEIEGLDKLKSITRIDMAGCETLSITFEESLFQVFSGIGGIIDIYLPMRDIPFWFRHQQAYTSDIFLQMPQSVPNHFLGIILWFNVDQTYQNKRVTDFSDFWACLRVIGLTYPRRWFCETSAWKPVPQSWITLIPQAQFPMISGEVIEVLVKDGTACIEVHCLLIGRVDEYFCSF